jgi:DNA-directed RNA polymerase II subunit RPB2
MELEQEDSWEVISSYFAHNGLVRQQLDSFDRFMTNDIQEIVDELGTLKIRSERNRGGDEIEVRVQFGQIYISKPTITEADGETNNLFPKEARLRNLSYSGSLYADVVKTIGDDNVETFDKVYIGEVPIMLQSSMCSLHNLPQGDLMTLGECPYDQVRFITFIYTCGFFDHV